jgi:hypothetical protein
MPIAQLALPERPPLAIGVSGERGGADAAAPDVAVCRISAGPLTLPRVMTPLLPESVL